ncbi:MAG: hypothetical protein H6842_13315 [Rhodospirillaceae bacterium]|nr:hypothetical protein [Rhodospirillaceae bacterium]
MLANPVPGRSGATHDGGKPQRRSDDGTRPGPHDDMFGSQQQHTFGQRIQLLPNCHEVILLLNDMPLKMRPNVSHRLLQLPQRPQQILICHYRLQKINHYENTQTTSLDSAISI